VTVIDHLDGLGESAAVMGAVNCVVRRGERLIGENTDGKGFLKSLRPDMVVAGIDPDSGIMRRALEQALGLAGER